MAIRNFAMTQKSNWLGIAEQSHGSLTFRNRRSVRSYFIKPMRSYRRTVRPKEERGLCKTHNESVYVETVILMYVNMIFDTWPHKRRECKHLSKKPMPPD